MGYPRVKDIVNNLKVVMQNDRRIRAGAIFLAVVVVLVCLVPKTKHNKIAQIGNNRQTAASKPKLDEEGYEDFLHAMTAMNKEQDERIKKLVNQMQSQKIRQQDDAKQVQALLESIVDKVEGMDRDIGEIQLDAKERVEYGGTQGADGLVTGDISLDPDALDTFGDLNETDVPPPPIAPQMSRMSIISPGDSVSVKLLTGVNAPVDGTPYPVVFQLAGPITGPDGSTLDLGEARLIAAAQGSETDGRVLYRLADLAIRHKDGRRSIVKVDGWVLGEDGIRGMRGRLIDKLGRLIAATAGVTFMGEMADQIGGGDNVTNIFGSDGLSVDRDDFDNATASAFESASDRLGQILLDRYEKLIPVVEVLSGREVVAVFSSPAEVEILDDESAGFGDYASLD